MGNDESSRSFLAGVDGEAFNPIKSKKAMKAFFVGAEGLEPPTSSM
jgi:hypothetical protein